VLLNSQCGWWPDWPWLVKCKIHKAYIHSFVSPNFTEINVHKRALKVMDHIFRNLHKLFEISLLRDITSNITISGTSRAVVYNENFRLVDIKCLDHLHTFGRNSKDKEHPWKLTEKSWRCMVSVDTCPILQGEGFTKCARLCNCF